MTTTEQKIEWFAEMEKEKEEIEDDRTKNKNIKKACCFNSFYHDNSLNEYSTCCGVRVRRVSQRLRKKKKLGTTLRRTTRHWWCLHCHTNGERGGHTFCGMCGFVMVSTSSTNAQRDIMDKCMFVV